MLCILEGVRIFHNIASLLASIIIPQIVSNCNKNFLFSFFTDLFRDFFIYEKSLRETWDVHTHLGVFLSHCREWYFVRTTDSRPFASIQWDFRLFCVKVCGIVPIIRVIICKNIKKIWISALFGTDGFGVGKIWDVHTHLGVCFYPFLSKSNPYLIEF